MLMQTALLWEGKISMPSEIEKIFDLSSPSSSSLLQDEYEIIWKEFENLVKVCTIE